MKQELSDKVAIPSEFIDEVVQGNEDDKPIIKLNEKGQKEFKKRVDDKSLNFIRQFIDETHKNKDKVTEEYYQLICRLEDIIKEHDAPWYVPFYQGVRNILLSIIFVNMNSKLFGDKYTDALQYTINQLQKIMNDFEKDIEETEFTYEQDAVIYNIPKILKNIQEEYDIEVDLVEEYKKYEQKIREKRAEKNNNFLKMYIIITELINKLCNHHLNKKQKVPYKYIFINMINDVKRDLDKKETKIVLKKPCRISTAYIEKLTYLLLEKHGDVHTIIELFRITPDIIKKLELPKETLEMIKDKKVLKFLENDLKKMKDISQLNSIMKDFNLTEEDIQELKDILEGELS